MLKSDCGDLLVRLHKGQHRGALVSETLKAITAGYLSFHPMARCVVHALKGLACRAPALLAHTEVTKNLIFFNGSKA